MDTLNLFIMLLTANVNQNDTVIGSYHLQDEGDDIQNIEYILVSELHDQYIYIDVELYDPDKRLVNYYIE